MKLHYGTLSSNSRRVRIAANLLRITLEEVAVDLRDPAHRASLAAINPNSKVPVLVDGDFVLWESIAIMQYLCDVTPGQTLYPTAPRARADVNRWLSWAQSHWSPAIGGISWENVWKKFVTGDGPDVAHVKRNEAFLAQFATVLDQHLAQASGLGPRASGGHRASGWLVGDSITLADVAVAAPLMMTKLARLPLWPYQNIQAWYERLRDLPAWKATEPQQLAHLEAQFDASGGPGPTGGPRPEA